MNIKLTLLPVIGFRLIASFGNLALFYVVSRFHSQETLGLVSIFVSAGLGLSLLSRFGSDVLLIKYLPPAFKDCNKENIKSICVYYFYRSLLLSVFAVLIYAVFSKGSDFLEIILIVAVINLMAIMSAVNKSSLNPVASTFYEPGYAFFFSAVVMLISAALSVKVGGSDVVFLISFSMFMYVIAVFLFFVYKYKWMLPVKVNKNKSYRKENLETINYGLIAVAGYLYSYGNVWFAGRIFDLTEVAFLAVAARLVFAINFALVISNAVFNPKFSILCRDNNKERLEVEAGRSLMFMLGMAALPFMFLVLCPGFLLDIFNVEGEAAIFCLRVMALAQIVNVVTGNASAILNLIGLESYVRNIVVISSFLSCAMAVFLGYEFGIKLFVIGFSLGVVVQNIVLVFFLYKKTGVNIYKGMLAWWN